MNATKIQNGSRVVIISVGSLVSARLYVNGGETATLQCWKGKTVSGAEKWAKRILGL